MTQPLIVLLPHSLGKAEAIRRLQSGLRHIRAEYGQVVDVAEEIWNDDRLALEINILKQRVRGSIEVFEDRVRVQAELPWLLGRLAKGAQGFVQKRGALMLEKK